MLFVLICATWQLCYDRVFLWRSGLQIAQPLISVHARKLRVPIPSDYNHQEQESQQLLRADAMHKMLTEMTADNDIHCSSAIDYGIPLQYMILQRDHGNAHTQHDVMYIAKHIANPEIIWHNCTIMTPISSDSSFCSWYDFARVRKRSWSVNVCYMDENLIEREHVFEGTEAWCIQNYIDLFQAKIPCISWSHKLWSTLSRYVRMSINNDDEQEEEAGGGDASYMH